MRRFPAFLCLLFLPILAGAQDYSLSPRFGSFRFDGAATRTLELTAGGSVDAQAVGGIGFVSDAPSFSVTLGRSGRLSISVDSPGDTTLLVNAPDVAWYADDDTNNLNPQLIFDTAEPGRYDVWVGVWSGRGVDARVAVRFEEGRAAVPTTRLSSGAGWTAADYAAYDFRSFARSDRANSRIDFDAIDYGLLHAAIFYETNRQRVANNLRPFDHHPDLEEAAAGHSRDMRDRGFFSHTSPVSGKQSLADRARLVGFSYRSLAENIAITFGIEYEAGRGVFNPQQNGGYFSYTHRGDPILNHSYLGLGRSVVNQWMNSPGHRANILNPELTHLGAGGAHFADPSFYDMDKFYFTQNFGTPR